MCHRFPLCVVVTSHAFSLSGQGTASCLIKTVVTVWFKCQWDKGWKDKEQKNNKFLWHEYICTIDTPQVQKVATCHYLEYIWVHILIMILKIMSLQKKLTSVTVIWECLEDGMGEEELANYLFLVLLWGWTLKLFWLMLYCVLMGIYREAFSIILITSLKWEKNCWSLSTTTKTFNAYLENQSIILHTATMSSALLRVKHACTQSTLHIMVKVSS